MTRQKKASKRNIEIVKQIIRAHQRLFDAVFIEDRPETQAILHQMMHGKPQHKSIKLYQYLLESFLLSWRRGPVELGLLRQATAQTDLQSSQTSRHSGSVPEISLF